MIKELDTYAKGYVEINRICPKDLIYLHLGMLDPNSKIIT